MSALLNAQAQSEGNRLMPIRKASIENELPALITGAACSVV